MKNILNKKYSSVLILGLFIITLGLLSISCGDKDKKGDEYAGGTNISGKPYGKESFGDVVKRRGLNAEDVLSAAKTYTPDNLKDEYVSLNSGGQEGNLPMYTIPSMRMLKYVPTNTRQPYSGFGYSEETWGLLEDGFIDGQEILWGDTHHPGFSETEGIYNGRWAVINDKANPRVYIYDLNDWHVKQVIKSPIYRSNHGGCFFTPDSRYFMEASQYPAPLDWKYHELSEANFEKYWRGGLTYWRFDNEAGRVDEKASFTFEFPPYTQDLSDAGKLDSYGWGFTNSFCTEMYYGGIESGRPPFEAGCSSRDVDYLHVTNWKKAEELLKNGTIKPMMVRGHRVIKIADAVKHNLFFLIPEPKSPHGVDVDPTGQYIVVAGKLDSHAWVYKFDKIMDAINNKRFEGKDRYGIPIIKLEDALHGSVEVGLGPLHSQYDSKKGVIYTSIYVDSRITKWDYINLKVLGHVPSHYNVGHLVAASGDTQDPHGKYLISLNKLSIDRFNPVGPLHPQNHQLIDISGDGDPKVIYDMPLPMGEPHYTALMRIDQYKSNAVYPLGTNIATNKKSKYFTDLGAEKVDVKGNDVRIYGTIKDGKVTPENINVTQGQTVYLHLTNHGQSKLDHYVYQVSSYDKMYHYSPGETATIKFLAEKSGMYPLLMDSQNSPDKRQLIGYLAVNFNQKAETDRVLAYTDRINADMKMQSFKPSAIELENLLPGELEYLNYGCSACHKFAEEFNGPDLFMVDMRRDDKWLKEWIMDPESKMKDADIEAMRQHYKLAMPNQNVSDEDANKIIAFLKAKTEQVKKEKASESTTETTGGDYGNGKETYDTKCMACHATGVTGAPKLDEKDRWAIIASQGMNVIQDHAVKGFQGKQGVMPPKGGFTDLSDDDIKNAIKYMLHQAGATAK
ncbi:MAG: Sec-dependent nitrous-oxide reductase [Bacteroidota bacterium]